MTVKEFLHQTVVKHPRLDTLDIELLLAFHLKKDRAFLRAFDDTHIDNKLLSQLNNEVDQLVDGYPLAYLLGEKDFWDMTLKVSKDTLIPRADTETLIEVTSQLLPQDFDGSLIDLGTGSGAIAIALNRIFPQAKTWACDFSENALAIARENAQHWQTSPIIFFRSDWLKPLDNTAIPEKFDLIVSNPPYIEENDSHLAALSHEPITALTAPEKGLADIKQIIVQAQKHLQNDGWLVLEHGYDQGQAVRDLLLDNPQWKNVRTHRDLGDNERITITQFIG